jgi:hypothetical protein
LSTSVTQHWLESIPIRMQATLLLSLRGPDTHNAPNIKHIQRWMRGLAYRPGNLGNVLEFMAGEPDLPELVEKSPLAKELEFCSIHFFSHLMHGLEVIGYRYPDPRIANRALKLATSMADLLHLPFESKAVFEERLKTLEWPGGEAPQDFQQAKQILDSTMTPEHAKKLYPALKEI